MDDTAVKIDRVIELLIAYDTERPETLGDMASRRAFYAERIKRQVLFDNLEAVMPSIEGDYERFKAWASDSPHVMMSYIEFKYATIDNALQKAAAQ